METLSPEVLEDLRHGRAPRERKLAVCSTGAHMAPQDRAEILAVLANDQDEVISTRAQDALLSYSADIFLDAVKREASATALHMYVARNLATKAGVVDALVANRHVSGDALALVVHQMTKGHVQVLLEELERVAAFPALAAALEHAPMITLEQKGLLLELKKNSMEQPNLAEAAEEAEPDPVKRQTLLQSIGRMTVAQRVQFAMKGSSEARRALIRDTNKVVQRAVLQSPRLTDQEVEAYASMTNLTDEILRLIAGNRVFRKNYTVVRNLINNAKTPLDVTLHMLPILNAVDLKKLTTNKNVPETLRTTALKLQRTRAQANK